MGPRYVGYRYWCSPFQVHCTHAWCSLSLLPLSSRVLLRMKTYVVSYIHDASAAIIIIEAQTCGLLVLLSDEIRTHSVECSQTKRSSDLFFFGFAFLEVYSSEKFFKSCGGTVVLVGVGNAFRASSWGNWPAHVPYYAFVLQRKWKTARFTACIQWGRIGDHLWPKLLMFHG